MLKNTVIIMFVQNAIPNNLQIFVVASFNKGQSTEIVKMYYIIIFPPHIIENKNGSLLPLSV